MDQFGVLVESIGFKAHGKSSAPMADLKSSSNNKPPNNNLTASSNGDIFGINQSNSTTAADDLDAIFGSNTKPPTSHDDDVFGGLGFGAFQASSSTSYNHNDVDDVFGLSSGSGDYFDVLGNRVSPVVKTKPVDVDDLIGSFGGMGFGINNGGKQPNVMKSSGFNKTSLKMQETADLLSGFGAKTSSVNGRNSEANTGVRSAKSFSGSADDPFGMFETTQGSTYNGTSDYLDSLFSSGARSNTRSNQSSTTEDSVYDSLFNNNVVPKKQNKSSSNSSKPNSSTTDDFSYLFGMGVAPTSSGEFQEIEGETEERRKARYSHHMATRKRMNDALHEKNKRDLQAQQEQDEKHRVAATLDGDIKRWAVGKEGNLRALISSLQHVLWAGSGWQPISLTDLITSTAVKKAYYKATLCVHPDKVQQKGASVQQKYIAEKVFDLLKEAWNKFNAEEFKKQ